MTNDQANKLQEAMQEVDKGFASTKPRVFPVPEQKPANLLTILMKIEGHQGELMRELERIRRFLGME